MHIIYSNNAPRTGGFNISKLDPYQRYEEHCLNYFKLRKVSTNGTFLEKRQAEHEMLIAERKMKFWGRKLTAEQIATITRQSRRV